MNERVVCIETALPGMTLLRRGKVRDVYQYGERLLMIATDRVSAFDVVMPTPIPMKGAVLTQLSRFWFDMMRDLVPSHLVSADAAEFPPDLQPHRAILDLRSMLTLRAGMFPVECVVRGYLAGSGWKDYRASGKVCGIPLPPGLRECEALPEPIYTPAFKAETGHDENIPFEETVRMIGAEHAGKLRDLTLAIYRRASAYALEKGIVLADAKFEFGLHEGRIILCDEALTPDASRFWPLAGYEPGRAQPSFDKQYVRDYLEEIRFNKQPPAPALPDHVVRGTTARYLEAYRLLTGSRLE